MGRDGELLSVCVCGQAHPVLIGGVNRSGTSLVRQLVGSHPEIALPPLEFEFFKRLAIPSHELSMCELRRFVDEMLELPKVSGWGLDRRSVLTYASADPSARGLFVAALRAYANSLGKPRFGDKTTGNEHHIRTFDRWFGGRYTFVHVLRHPVATFASTCWYGGGEHRLDSRVWAREWTRSVLIALHARRTRKDRYVVVRYEDLVRDPEGELRRICSCAHVAYESRMMTMADFAEKENSSFEQLSASYEGLIRTRDAIDRKSWIPADDLAALRLICRASAALVGYDIDDAGSAERFAPAGRPTETRVRLSSGVRRAGRVASRKVRSLSNIRASATVHPPAS